MCAPSPSASWLTGSSIDTPPGACWLMTAYAASDASCDASTEISSHSIHLQGKLSAVAIQPADALAALRRVDLFAGLSEPELRSEERRVGEEGGWRGWGVCWKRR